MSRPGPLIALSLATLLTACEATRWIGQSETLELPRPSDDPRQDLAPGTEQRARATIAQLEDARDDGGGYLQLLIGHGAAEIRARAALALGRLPRAHFGSSVTEALLLALGDDDPDVRRTAAFALGMRGGPTPKQLRSAANDDDHGARAAAIEALSKLSSRASNEIVLHALRDAVAEVRSEAAVGPHRWSRSDEDADDVDAALLAALASEQHADVRWRLVFTLQRRRAPAARDALLALLAEDADAPDLERLYAAKGLSNLLADESIEVGLDVSRTLAATVASDPDLRVVVEATHALGRLESGSPHHVSAWTGLESACRHPSFHVRAAACESLGRLGDPRGPKLLEAFESDSSRTVRVAALVARTKHYGRTEERVREWSRSDDAVLRAGAAQAAAELPQQLAFTLLEELSHDEHLRVVGAALTGLGRIEDDAARARLLAFVDGDDNGLRVAAIDALGERLRPDDAPLLRASFDSARGDIASEVRVAVLHAAGALGTDEAFELVERGVNDQHPYVAQVASDVLREHGRPARAPRYEPTLLREVPLPGRDYDPSARPRAEIVTSKGSLHFELLPAEAPLHVYSFLALAREGHYDGLAFHRVVSDFVVQGGCYRGDGNGSGTWRGADDALRQEIGPRKYVRGSLGMPRNADLESGGSQVFVTHRPTPHLDGRYTIFGELRDGFDVLDALEVGDTIRAIRLR